MRYPMGVFPYIKYIISTRNMEQMKVLPGIIPAPLNISFTPRMPSELLTHIKQFSLRECQDLDCGVMRWHLHRWCIQAPTCSKDKIILSPWQNTWSLNWSGEATAFGHWQTGSIQPTDRGVLLYTLHWPDRDKAEIITCWIHLMEGTLIPVVIAALCPCCYSWSELPQSPINSFPGQSLIKYWWLSQL